MLETRADERGDVGDAITTLEEQKEEKGNEVERDAWAELEDTDEERNTYNNAASFQQEMNVKYGKQAVSETDLSPDDLKRLKQLRDDYDEARRKSRKRLKVQEKSKKMLADNKKYQRIFEAIKML